MENHHHGSILPRPTTMRDSWRLFNGYVTLMKLHFDDDRFIAGHRQIESQAYQATKKNQKACYCEFSKVPNFLAYVEELEASSPAHRSLTTLNTGLVKLGDGRVVCLTETQRGSIVIDPKMLDTLGEFEYGDSLRRLIHSAQDG